MQLASGQLTQAIEPDTTPAVARPRLISILLAAGIVSAVVGSLATLVWGYVATAAVVTVAVDGLPVTVRTHEATVGSLLAEMEVTLQPEDRVSPPLDTPLPTGTGRQPLNVNIQRARPLLFDGDSRLRTLRTHAATLSVALAEAGISLGPADEVAVNGQPARPDTPLPAPIVQQFASRPRVRPVYPWRQTTVAPLTVSVRRAVPLTLDEGGPPLTVWTTATTVGEALAREGMLFYAGDRVQPGLGTPLSAGLRVEIRRSKPVTIQTKQDALSTRTLADTVADFLSEHGLVLSGLDRVEPALATPLTDNLRIRLTRVEHAYEIEEDVTRYATVWEPDPESEIDTARLDQEGVNGITRHRYLVVLEDGAPITRTLQDTWLAQQPITRTFKYGTKIVLRELETPDGPLTYWRKIRMYATSYSPARSGVSPDKAYYGRTRLGLPVRKGLVAVDPSVVALRTQLYVPGYGPALAADTGSGVDGRWIDLGFTDDEYVPWHRCVDVYLLGPPPPSYLITYRLPSYPNAPCLRN